MSPTPSTFPFRPSSSSSRLEGSVVTGVRQRLRRWVECLEGWAFYHLSRASKVRRFQRFREVTQPRPGELLLDIGAGGGDFWRATAGPGASAMLATRMVALDRHAQMPGGLFRWRVIGDARQLPFRDGAFGIVFSNSVLEHVGGAEAQRKMAREMERVGGRYFAQVPSRWFPIEAHFFIPFLSYLPVRWQVRITRSLFGFDEEIHLLSRKQAQALFPDAVVETERFWGLAKAYWIHRG